MKSMLKIKRLGLLTLVGFVFLLLNVSFVSAQTLINNISVNKANGELIINSSRPVKARIQSFKGDAARVIIDIDNAKLASNIKDNDVVVQDILSNFPVLSSFVLSEYGTGIITVRFELQVPEDMMGQVKVIPKDDNKVAIRIPELPKVIEAKPIVEESNYSPPPNIPIVNNSSETNQLKAELIKKEREIEQLQTDIQFLRQQAPATFDQSVVSSDVAGLKAENQKLKEDLVVAKSRLALAAQKLTSSGGESEELEKAKSQLSILSDQLNEALAQIKTLSGSSSVQEMQSLRDQLSEAKAISTENQDQLNKSLAVIEALKGKFNELKKGTEDFVSIKGELENSKQLSVKLEGQLKTAQTEVDKLRQQLGQVKTTDLSNAAQDEKVRQLQNQLAISNKQLEGLKMELDKRVVSDQIIQDLKKKINEQQQKLDITSKGIDNKNEKLSKTSQIEKENEMLKAEVNQLRSKANAFISSSQGIQTVNDQLKAENQNLKSKMIQIDKINAQLTVDNAQFKKSNKDLQVEIADLSRKTTDSESLKQLQAELDQTKKLLAQAKNQNSRYPELEQKYGKAAQELQMEKDRADALKQKNDRLTRKVEVLNSTLSETSANDRVVKLQSEVNALNFKLEDAQSQADRQIAELKEQLSVASSVILTQSEDINKLQSIKPKVVVSTQPIDVKQAVIFYQNAVKASQQGKMVDAINLLNKSISIDPNFVRPYVVLGELYLQSADLNNAMETLKKALILDPDNNAAHHHLGNVYLAMGNFDNAMEQFKLAIGINALTNYGSTLKNQGNIDAAINTYETAIQLAPADADLHYNLATAYNSKNLIKKAAEEYIQAIKLRPDYLNAHYNLALIYAQEGNNDKAISHFQEYLRLSPNAKDADKIRKIIGQLKG